MQYILFILTFLLPLVCCAEFSNHLKKILEKVESKEQIRNIDFIYLINLDQRPEKKEACLSQLSRYQIVPYRFSAVCGWDLSAAALQEVGVKFTPTMLLSEWALDAGGDLKSEFLQESSYGKTLFSSSMALGAIGCSLSHLSVLEDAYQSQYETIWVLEDDIDVQKDPHLLSDYIDKLDALLGKEGWDILYTDMDFKDPYFESLSPPLIKVDNDFNSTTHLKGDFSFFWRPDIDLSDKSRFTKRTVLSEDFILIGSRSRTHSMVIRRSGIKKILDFEKKHHLFLPYDHEIATVPGIKLINLKTNLITYKESVSDTQKNRLEPRKEWETYKKETLANASQISGWFSKKKAEKLIEFIYKKKPDRCVEIGAFGGSTSYQIARTLSFLKQGTLHAIDAWDSETAIEGLTGEKTIQWWKSINMNMLHKQFLSLFSNTPLQSYCNPIKKRADLAASFFGDQSIDFLYIDGNDSQEWNLKNIHLYFPKVKEGGYICFNRVRSSSKNKTTAFLMNTCYWLKEDSTEDCLFFQKKANPSATQTLLEF